MSSFSDIGKKQKDLFEKNYAGKIFREIKLVSKASNGLSIEANNYNPDATATLSSSGKIKKKADWGEMEAEIHTIAKPSASKGSVTFNSLLPGTKLKLSTSAAVDLGIEASYAASPFDIKLNMKSDGNKNTASLESAFRYGDFLLGNQLDLDASSGISLTDYNFGLQYNHCKDLIIAAKTAKGRNNVNLSAWYKYSCCTQLGLAASTDIAGGSAVLNVGFDHSFNDKTNIKSKIDSNMNIHNAVEYRGNGFKINMSAQLNPSASKKTLGYGFTFGDY